MTKTVESISTEVRAHTERVSLLPNFENIDTWFHLTKAMMEGHNKHIHANINKAIRPDDYAKLFENVLKFAEEEQIFYKTMQEICLTELSYLREE